MARPMKAGIDYFPLDVIMDEKVELIDAKYGNAGFGVLIKLYQSIYRNGYFIEIDEEKLLLLKNRLHVEIDYLKQFITDCLRWKIFDDFLYNKYQILTSKGIQKRYFEITKRRKEQKFSQDFLLISDVSESYQNIVNANINSKNANINSKNADIKKQSKEKESKVKNISPEIQNFVDEFISYINQQKGNLAPKSNNLRNNSLDTVDKLIRIDGFDLDYIKNVCRWALKDEFWSGAFFSLSELRKTSQNGNLKFQNMANAYEKPKHNGKKQESKAEPDNYIDPIHYLSYEESEAILQAKFKAAME